MISTAFQTAYSTLNLRQREAVEAVDGPVMVVAGPGTGKTQILTLRIANILARTDTAPENILALTFTESAAANMRQRLADLIGPNGYYVEISTFHGYANRLIQEYPEYFPAIVGARNATDTDQIALIRAILEDGRYEKLKPLGDPFYYVDDIVRAITETKREGYDPAGFREALVQQRKDFDAVPDKIHEKGPYAGRMKLEYEKMLAAVEKNEELADTYAAYEQQLREHRLYDFEDMVLEVIRSFEAHPNFLLEAQEAAQYVLVDEHQDTNGAQNRLLELLASFHSHPNLFVVGDEKQAIYRFQGASLENFLYFQKKYPDARLIYLEDNYRSTQSILDSAQSLIEHNAATIRAPLVARRTPGGPAKRIGVVGAASLDAEHFFLATAIRDLLAAGTLPAEVAVLYRENRDADPIIETLERAGIPFGVESDRNILADPEIKKLLTLFEAIYRLGDETCLVNALHLDFFDIPALDVWKTLDLRIRKGYPSLYKLLSRPGVLQEAELSDPAKMEKAVKLLERWKRRSKNENFLAFFEEVIRESGFLEHILAAPGYFDKVGKLNSLFDEMKKTVGNRGEYGLGDFIAYLAILREHRVMLKARPVFQPDRVRLMTAHKAKGLEFDHVFITGARDGKWGNRRRSAKFKLPFHSSVEANALEKNEDERRLFYMALTRARKAAVILWSARDREGRSQVPSQFIAEIRDELKEEVRFEETETEAIARREAQFSPRRPAEPRLEDRAFLREVFRRRGFSATGLNNYLECPWKYFYLSLLRLPQTDTPQQMYGTAMHAGLQRFFSARAAGETVDKEFLIARFEESLGRMPLSSPERTRIAAQGRKVLSAYFDHYAADANYRVLTEYKVEGVVLAPDIVLTGKMDKLEFGDVPGEVTVVDYKVKRPESRNWIEGGTANSDGHFKRQLVFYKILLDGIPEKGLRMKAGVIDFVEPTARGTFKQERFEIAEQEAIELKAKITEVGGEILDLKFWDKTCGERDCVYCAFRQTKEDRTIPA